MTGRGHRKSLTQAKLDGTARKDRHVDPVVIAPGAVEPPSFLGEPARDAWDRWIAPRVSTGWYEPAEAPLLAMWCELLVRVFAVGAATPLVGIYEQEDAYGRVEFKKHPGVTAMIQLMAEFRALSAKLGLDPLSRMALADLEKPVGGGAQLPKDAPPAFKPKAV
jgi:phage terminase small subunit